jgi:A/G-specific adenine glycosylase
VGRRQPAFEGSDRQARGRVLAVLRERGGASVRELAAETGMPLERTSRAAEGLAGDGLASLDGDATIAETQVRID